MIFYISYYLFEPSSEYVILTDRLQHLSVRWIKINVYIKQFFPKSTHACVKLTQSRLYPEKKIILVDCSYLFLRVVTIEVAL